MYTSSSFPYSYTIFHALDSTFLYLRSYKFEKLLKKKYVICWPKVNKNNVTGFLWTEKLEDQPEPWSQSKHGVLLVSRYFSFFFSLILMVSCKLLHGLVLVLQASRWASYPHSLQNHHHNKLTCSSKSRINSVQEKTPRKCDWRILFTLTFLPYVAFADI